MAKSQGTPPSRRGEPEQDQPSPGTAAWRTSRWGQAESNEAAPTEAAPPAPASTPAGRETSVTPPGAKPTPPEGQRQDQIEPQQPILLKATPAIPSAPFPLPRQQADKTAGAERQQRSYAWLKRLEGTDDPGGSIPRALRRGPRSRRKLVASGLLAFLCVLLVVTVLAVSIPGLREHALSLFGQQAAPSPTVNSAQGVLIAQSNVPNSTLTFHGKTYQLTEQDQTFWSIQIPAIPPGTYSLSISAPHYTAASGSVQIQARQEQMVSAFLTLDPLFLMSQISSGQNQISGQALANPVAAGAQYTGASTAAAPLKVTVGYRVVSLVSTPAPSVLEIGQSSPPAAALLSGVVTPDILFTNAASGALVDEYRPNALPAAHFLVALSVSVDASGKAIFALGNPAALTTTTTSGAALVVPGGVTPDLALLFALVGTSLDQGTVGGNFTCIGQVDALAHPGTKPDPEDGLLLSVGSNNAHYFYRWGQFWTTNLFAQTLTPNLPQANTDTLVLAQSLIDARTQGQQTGCA